MRRRYGIQRRIGYKWVERCQRDGLAGPAASATVDSAHAGAVLESVFRRYRLPRSIRGDNGAPFASRV